MVFLTVVAVVQLAVIGLLVFYMRAEREYFTQTLADFLRLAEEERRELITRIQRPEYTPVATVARKPEPLTEDELRRAGALARVGIVE